MGFAKCGGFGISQSVGIGFMRKYNNFIGGEWIEASSGKRYQTVNPADTREQVADYPLSGAEEARAAIAAADGAYPAWGRSSLIARGRILS